MMARKKKMGSTADYIIPMGVVLLGVYVLNKIGLFGSSASGSSILPSAASSSPATQEATLATDDSLTAFYQAQPTNTNPFLPDMYNGNPSCPSISPAQAASLWADVQTAYNGTGFLSFFKPQPDMSTLLPAFQAICVSGCDISEVSYLCYQATNQDLGTYMFNSFFNDQTGASGSTNAQMMSNFVYWAFSLPTGLD